jgi:hypothetical protein
VDTAAVAVVVVVVVKAAAVTAVAVADVKAAVVATNTDLTSDTQKSLFDRGFFYSYSGAGYKVA